MKHIIFDEAEFYSVAVLIKTSSFNKHALQTSYVNPLCALGVQSDTVIGFNLKYDSTGKAPVKFIKEYLDTLLPAMDSIGVKWLYVADSNYFKALTKQTKAEPHHGYVLPCKYKGYEHMNVVLGINHQTLIYNPELQAKLDMGITTLASAVAGNYQALGTGIIHSAQYPETLAAIEAALQSLHQYSELTCDIEAFSLRFNEAGIGTISFAWDQHNGVAIACDYKPILCQADIDAAPEDSRNLHGYREDNIPVKRLLKRFFIDYKGELTWHNAAYDLKVIIYELWMKNL